MNTFETAYFDTLSSLHTDCNVCNCDSNMNLGKTKKKIHIFLDNLLFYGNYKNGCRASSFSPVLMQVHVQQS